MFLAPSSGRQLYYFFPPKVAVHEKLNFPRMLFFFCIYVDLSSSITLLDYFPSQPPTPREGKERALVWSSTTARRSTLSHVLNWAGWNWLPLNCLCHITALRVHLVICRTIRWNCIITSLSWNCIIAILHCIDCAISVKGCCSRRPFGALGQVEFQRFVAAHLTSNCFSSSQNVINLHHSCGVLKIFFVATHFQHKLIKLKITDYHI